MNTIKTMLTIAALATVLFATQSCDNMNNHNQNDDMHNSGMTDDQMNSKDMQHNTYACPMHPQHTGIKGGKCTECEMDLVEMSSDMLNQNNMLKMMNDSTKRHNMMGYMMNNPTMMANMMQMMHKEGMMSQECMQSGMKMMSDKGMDMGNMMQEGNMENKESHNY